MIGYFLKFLVVGYVFGSSTSKHKNTHHTACHLQLSIGLQVQYQVQGGSGGSCPPSHKMLSFNKVEVVPQFATDPYLKILDLSWKYTDILILVTRVYIYISLTSSKVVDFMWHNKFGSKVSTYILIIYWPQPLFITSIFSLVVTCRSSILRSTLQSEQESKFSREVYNLLKVAN